MERLHRLPASATNLLILEKYLRNAGKDDVLANMWEYLRMITPAITESPSIFARKLALQHCPPHLLRYVDNLVATDEYIKKRMNMG